jgi:hypothetical protein
MPVTNFPNGVRAPLFNSSGAQPSNIGQLTDSSGGTASTTLAVIGATYAQAEVANAVASLAAKINLLEQALEDAQVTA